jgi:glycerol uptake facilitator-like aquaporin
LGNTLPTGATLVVLITMLGPTSGAYFNPAVSLVFTLCGALSLSLCLQYVLVQIIGGILGFWAAHLMLNDSVLQLSLKRRTGPSQWFAEAVATLGLVFTILATL